MEIEEKIQFQLLKKFNLFKNIKSQKRNFITKLQKEIIY